MSHWYIDNQIGRGKNTWSDDGTSRSTPVEKWLYKCWSYSTSQTAEVKMSFISNSLKAMKNACEAIINGDPSELQKIRCLELITNNAGTVMRQFDILRESCLGDDIATLKTKTKRDIAGIVTKCASEFYKCKVKPPVDFSDTYAKALAIAEATKGKSRQR